MIRLILVLLFITTFFIISIPVYLILWIIGKFNMDARNKIALKIIQTVFKIILFISGTKIDARGVENIPKDTAVLYVGNHVGFFDIISGYTFVQGVTGFVSKKEFKKVPFLNIWMIFVNCLFLDRNNIRQGAKTILQGIKYLKNGISIFIFPEGTRSKDAKMIPFKEGSMKLASKSKVPIQPIAFRGSSTIFEDNFPRIKKGTIIIEFGKPIVIEELSAEEQKHLGAYTQNIIQEMLDND